MRTHFTATAVAAFYRAISRWADEANRLYLVMDNWPVHYHRRAWKGIQEDPRISVLWLPTYSPWLNPAEKLWKWVRQRRVHMHTHSKDLRELRKCIDGTLNLAATMPEEILSFTGTGDYKLYST